MRGTLRKSSHSFGSDGRRKYNDLCRRCVHPCKQSSRAVIIACPHYFSKRSGQCMRTMPG